ncbi:MAG: SpoIIE family protein phosphatase [Clostridia bacterium]|nr:SpoIIE family protein phosphatase [Clostridia bacterium]
MKKLFRPTIRKKLFLLTVVLSIAMVLSAVTISYRLFSENAEQNIIKLCDNSAMETYDLIMEEYYDFLVDYQSKIKAIYEENREVLEESINVLDTFQTFEEREKFYTSLTSGLFPPKNAFGATLQNIEFQNNYKSIVQFLDRIVSLEDIDGGYLFFYDEEHSNMVYLIDSSSENSLFYNFPCSIEKPSEVMLNTVFAKNANYSYYDDGFCYAFKPVKKSDTGEIFAYIAFNMFDSHLDESREWFAYSTLFIMLGATVLFTVFYLLFADKLILKNVKKLSESTEKFTAEIENNNAPVPVSSGVKAHDEIGTLSEKIDTMQKAIVGYVDSIEKKTAAEEKMKAELDLASKIQSESLRKDVLKADSISIESFLRPAKEVGGDFYDYFMLDEKRVFFYISDVTGKGVPAALFMMRAKELIKANIKRVDGNLALLAYDVNNELCAGNDEGMFITAFFGIIDMTTGKLYFLRAGHEPPFLKRGNTVEKIAKESNFNLGSFEDMDFVSDELTLQSGDTLLLYTDGLNEGINAYKEEFGYERIAETLKNTDKDILSALYGDLSAFASGEEQFDDVTMLLVKIAGEKTFVIKSPTFDSIPEVTDRISEMLKDKGEEFISETGIILDEIMNNCISYAFEGISDPELSVTVRTLPDSVEYIFSDNGIKFDPLSATLNDLSEDVLTRPDGGMGISLVKSMSDSITYEYKNNRNVLTVSKKVK